METPLCEITWPGSTDKVTINKVTGHSYDISEELTKTLVSAKPYFFPMVDGNSVNQFTAWMAKQGEIYNQGGIRIVARHTSPNSDNNLLAVAMSINRKKPDEAEFIVQTLNGYAGEEVDPLMLKHLKSLNKDNGRTLGTVDEFGVFKPI